MKLPFGVRLPGRRQLPRRLAVGIIVSLALGSNAGQLLQPSLVAASSVGVVLKPQSLALPASTFPAGSRVHGSAASNQAFSRLSSLHVIPSRRLGRVRGCVETAQWTWASPSNNSFYIQYLASVFQSSDAAARAFGDGEASLWEVGRRVSSSSSAGPFLVNNRTGLVEAYYLFHQGSIESELFLRYSPHSRAAALRAAFWYFQHAMYAAKARTLKLSGSATSSGSPGALPDIYTAPWGTGPVVKSPSLMVSPTTGRSIDPLSDKGLFRRFSRPPLAATSLSPASLTPLRGLARFTKTVSLGGDRGWYESTSLYSSSHAAGAAFAALRSGNKSRKGLQPLPLAPTSWKAGQLQIFDSSSAWKLGNEKVFLFRKGNVILLLATVSRQDPSPLDLVGQVAATIPTWLHAAGINIVDSAGQPVTLIGLNWYGAEQSDFVVGGLDYEPYQAILQTISLLGYKTIRLPFSNELVEKNPVVSNHLAANPELKGLHALEILDRIINFAGSLGISVILDNHRSDAGWSAQENGLWYTPEYPDASWVSDWVALAQRYSVNNVVVGVDLRNEPHATAAWGSGNAATDWLSAAERGGNAVLAQNPNLLIIVEGVQNYSSAPGYWWGGNLMGVATNPVLLQFKDGTAAKSHLVYSAHDYGPDNCNGGCPWFNSNTTYASLSRVWDQYWGYITQDPARPYASPVWLGEFGTCNYQTACVTSSVPGSQGQWFESLLQYIKARHLSWTYWSVNGTESTAPPYRSYGALDWYGFLNQSWTGPNLMLQTALQSIRNP